MSRFSLSRQASRDLDAIFTYLEVKNRPAAVRVLSNVEKKCQLLASNPGTGSPCDDLAPNLRCFPVGNYVIYYRSVPTGVEIVRVVHGARDQASLFPTSPEAPDGPTP